MELCEQHMLYPKILRLGLPDQFIEQGTQEELRQIYGLDATSISNKTRDFLSKF